MQCVMFGKEILFIRDTSKRYTITVQSAKYKMLVRNHQTKTRLKETYTYKELVSQSFIEVAYTRGQLVRDHVRNNLGYLTLSESLFPFICLHEELRSKIESLRYHKIPYGNQVKCT